MEGFKGGKAYGTSSSHASISPSTCGEQKKDPVKRKSILVCFDLDETMVKGHVHNQLSIMGFSVVRSSYGSWLLIDGKLQVDDKNELNESYDGERIAAETRLLLRNTMLQLREPNDLKSLIDHLISKDHKIAITTFGAYPDAIKVLLKELGLTEDQIRNIVVIGGSPTRGKRNGKMEHIEKAKKLTGIKQNSDVVLIDDSIQNITIAGENGVRVVHVDDGFSWKNVEKTIDDMTSFTSQDHGV